MSSFSFRKRWLLQFRLPASDSGVAPYPSGLTAGSLPVHLAFIYKCWRRRWLEIYGSYTFLLPIDSPSSILWKTKDEGSIVVDLYFMKRRSGGFDFCEVAWGVRKRFRHKSMDAIWELPIQLLDVVLWLWSWSHSWFGLVQWRRFRRWRWWRLRKHVSSS